MKNLFKNLMLVAVAAMAFTACEQADVDQQVVNKTEGTTITLTAGFDEETRATLVDGDGEFLVKWESDDSIIFEATATDGSTVCAEAIDPVLKNDGASAEFTATFSKEIKPGTVKAYVSGYYYIYNWNWDGVLGEYVPIVDYYNLNIQYPEQDVPYYVVASAEFEYNGEEFISEPITFNHDFAYGKVTIADDVEVDSIVFKFNDNYTYRLEKLYNIEGNTFWFIADPMEVSTMDVTLQTGDYLTKVKSVDMTSVQNPLKFVAGEVSTFTLQGFTTKLDQPWGNATVDTNSIVFDWSDVEGATSYDIVLKSGEETIFSGEVTVSEYTATGLDSATDYTLSIVAKAEGCVDSDKATINATTSATREDMNKWANDTVVFTHMREITEVSNAYLFTTEEMIGKPTSDDFFMYLAFNNPVDLTQSGVYTISDLNYSWCYIWLPDNILSGWKGYSNYYGLSGFSNEFNPYHFYPNSGDTYEVYVDVVDGQTTISVYASCSWWSDIHFKGTWNGTITPTLATPQNLKATYSEGNVDITWDAVANATGYSIKVGDTTVTSDVNNTSVSIGEEPGTYTISVVATADGYNNSEAATTKIKISSGEVPGSGDGSENNPYVITSYSVRMIDGLYPAFDLVTADGQNLTMACSGMTHKTGEWNINATGGWWPGDCSYSEGSVNWDSSWSNVTAISEKAFKFDYIKLWVNDTKWVWFTCDLELTY